MVARPYAGTANTVGLISTIGAYWRMMLDGIDGITEGARRKARLPGICASTTFYR